MCAVNVTKCCMTFAYPYCLEPCINPYLNEFNFKAPLLLLCRLHPINSLVLSGGQIMRLLVGKLLFIGACAPVSVPNTCCFGDNERAFAVCPDSIRVNPGAIHFQTRSAKHQSLETLIFIGWWSDMGNSVLITF